MRTARMWLEELATRLEEEGIVTDDINR